MDRAEFVRATVAAEVEERLPGLMEMTGMDEETAREALMVRAITQRTILSGFDVIVNVLGHTPEHWPGKRLVAVQSCILDGAMELVASRDIKSLQIIYDAMGIIHESLANFHNGLLIDMIENGEISEDNCDEITRKVLEQHRTERGGEMVDELLAANRGSTGDATGD